MAQRRRRSLASFRAFSHPFFPLFAACLLSLLSASVLAQEIMKIASSAPGFSPGSVYERLGQGEVVAPFHGGLTVTHASALGLPENLGGALRPVRVYNSKTLEDAFLDDVPSIKSYTDVPHGALGTGWHLGYGRVLLRLTLHTLTKEDTSQPITRPLWYYQDESGAEHRLFRGGRVENWAGPGSEPAADWYFTNDGSYIRAYYDGAAHLWRLYFPDGSSRLAGGATAGAFIPAEAHRVVPPPGMVPWWDYVTNPAANGWYVTRITDRAGNAVQVAYNTYQNDPAGADYQPYGGAIASLTDSFGRAITFEYYPATDPAAPGLLSTITCAGRTERFSYTQVQWTRPGQLVGTTGVYPTLARVTDPAGLETVYGYTEYTRADGILRGLLTAVHYPTGAVSQYAYVSYPFPVPHPTESDPMGSITWFGLAVASRTVLVAPEGAPAGTPRNRYTVTWDRSQPHGRYLDTYMIAHYVQPVVETDPLGTRSVRFFVANSLPNSSFFKGSPIDLPPGTEVMTLRLRPGSTFAFNPANPTLDAVTMEIKRWQWGDAVVNGAVLGDAHQCMENDPDHWGGARVVFYGNLRVRRTESEEFAPPPGPLPVAAPFYGWRRVTENSLWDGFGHYLLARTSGTPEIGQQPPPGLGQPRVPGHSRISASSYDLKTDIPATGPPVVYQLDRAVLAFSGEGDLLPSGLGATGQFRAVASGYDAATGLLVSQVAYRLVQSGFAFDPATLALGAPAADAGDKALQIGYDGSGNVVRLFYSGGDGGNAYGFHFAWDHAGVSRMSRDGVTYDEFTRAIDPATSLIASQTDSNGFTTAFAYDALERLTAIRPPLPEHPTLVAYPNDTTTAAGETWATGHDILFYRGPEGFVLTTSDDVTGMDPGASYAHYLSDGLGRTWKTRTLMPDGSFSEAVTGYGPLGREVFTSLPYRAGDAAVSFAAVAHPLRTDIPGDAFSLYVPSKNGSAYGSWSSLYEEATAQNPLPLNGTAERLYRPLWAFRPDGTRTGTSYAGLVETATVYGIQTGAGTQSDSSTVYAKDILGRLLLVLPPAGASAVHTYDGLGNLARVDLLTLAVAPREACDAVLGANGGTNALLAGQAAQQRSFSYDALGRLRSASNPENGTTNYLKYDCIGNLLEAQDANGAAAATPYKLASSYDAVGRLLSTVKADAATGATIASLIQNTYDTLPGFNAGASLGKLVQSASLQPDFLQPSLSRTTTLTFSYNGLNGRMDFFGTGSDASGAQKDYGSSVTYDSYGQVAQRLLPESGATVVESYQHGLPLSRNFVDGATRVAGLGGLQYTPSGALQSYLIHGRYGANVAFDDFTRPLGFALSGPAGPLWGNGSFAGSPYQYDGAGNIASIGASATQTDSFQYDLLSRLTAATVNDNGVAHGYSYQYDAFGNLTSRVESAQGASSVLAALSDPNRYANAASAPDAATLASYVKAVAFEASLATDPATGVTNNRIASAARGGVIGGVNTGLPATNANYVYDPNGNLLDDGQFVYAYDALNRQTAAWHRDATKPLNRGLQADASAYDASGERAGRLAFDSAGVPKSFTQYLREGAAVVWENTWNASNAQAQGQKSYLYAGGRMALTREASSGTFTGALYVAQLQAQAPPGTVVSPPALGAPAFAYEDEGEEAEVTYNVQNLGADVAAFAVRLARLSPPPEGDGNDDDNVQVKRIVQPSTGWGSGVVAVVFDDLRPGAAYAASLTIQTTLGTVPVLGPRTLEIETATFTVPLAPAAPCAWARSHWEFHRGDAEGAEEELTVGWEHVAAGSAAYVVSLKAGTSETVLTAAPVTGNAVTLPVASLPLPANVTAGNLAITALNSGATAQTALPGGIIITPPPGIAWTYTYGIYATDHLGTVRYVRKEDAGGVLASEARFTYEPFAVELPSGAGNTRDNTHRFTGQERDPETGNDNFHFRMYSAGMGRFQKPDSIQAALTIPQTWNLYSYVVNNPVNFIDPTGREPKKEDDWWNDPEKVAKFNWLKSIPGVSEIDVPTWGWGNNLPGINVRVGIYFDKALNLSTEQKNAEYSRLQTEILGAAFESFGAIGILFDVFYGGDVSITMNPPGSWEPAQVTAANKDTVPIAPGSLNIIRTDNPDLAHSHWGSFFMNGKTGFIALGSLANSRMVREEIMHALGNRWVQPFNAIHHWTFEVDRENLLLSLGIVNPVDMLMYRQAAVAYSQAW